MDAMFSSQENIIVNFLLHVQGRSLRSEDDTLYLGRKVSINHLGREIINRKFCKVSFPDSGRILANMTSLWSSAFRKTCLLIVGCCCNEQLKRFL